jgi:hypothetical protein
MESKNRLLERYCPYFVRERLIRELIVFNFHGEGQSLRQYIDRIFRVAKFLDYRAGEEQLVERVIMNFHSSVLANTALMDRPRSFKDLYRMAGLVEERMAVGRERERVDAPVRGPSNARSTQRGGARSAATRSVSTRNNITCWGCGQPGHLARTCPQRQDPSGNGQAPGGQEGPGRTH